MACKPSYFDVGDILSSSESLPCCFASTVKHLGYLDVASESEDIASGTKLDLPLWLVRKLCNQMKHAVTVDFPKQYKEGYRDVYAADATVVNLHKLGPYFYICGSHLLDFPHPSCLLMCKTILQVFQDRFRRIMDLSQNHIHQTSCLLIERLDESERHILSSGERGILDFVSWESRKMEQISSLHG